jgi:SAM-dependent MidA family methyltransferase
MDDSARRDLDTRANARSGRPELVARIRRVIAAHGPITFDRFMELALYEPGLGYYAVPAGEPPGASGPLADFQTSPQAHSLFGWLLARELRDIWSGLGQPDPFVIAELGAGFGELAGHVLDGLAAGARAPRVEYHAVDVRLSGFDQANSPRRNLTPWPGLDALVRSGTKVHSVIANEFFDALPVHRLAGAGGSLREIYVDWSGADFVDCLGELSDPSLAAWIAPGGALPTQGWRGEACPRLEPVLRSVADLLDRGVVLTIDYG